MRMNPLLALIPAIALALGASAPPDYSPPPDEQQLPTAMHSAMPVRPVITVGNEAGDIIGHDNRAIQAAVDYIAALGGGAVEIGPGTYTMYDSLHLRSDVTVRGAKDRTILRKASGVTSPLVLDGDFGEQQFTVKDARGFEVGYGVMINDDNAGGFHTTVARITGRNGNTFSIDKPLMADCMVSAHAKASTIFPVISAYDTERLRIENIIVDGNKSANDYLNGCRGGGIFLYRSFGTVIDGCVVTDYNGDGISFQQSNDVTVTNCISENNASLGIHPGSGSQRPHVAGCTASGNGTDGLYLCWRVRHGLFENNTLVGNGRFGVSIGHKDSDNLLRNNIIRRNKQNGVFFRNETISMAPHRNRLENNTIEDNGLDGQYAAIRIRGFPTGLVFKNNIIRDTRPPSSQTQTIGFQIEQNVGDITMEGNKVDAQTPIQDNRKPGPEK